MNKENISFLAQNKEKYIAFTKTLTVDYDAKDNKHIFLHLKFLDLFRFLAGSLDKLSQSLTDDECKEIKKNFQHQFDLVRKKGVFPYVYVDSIICLAATSLPTREDFFDKLSQENITDDDYQRVIRVWPIFSYRTLRDYSDLYLKSDVLLLADIS